MYGGIILHIEEKFSCKLLVIVFFTFLLAYQSDVSAEDDVSQKIISEAESHLGTPFFSGGESPEGFNGSGFVYYVFRNSTNIYVPRYLSEQWDIGSEVERSELQPGDVVFFSNTYKEGISHNGIYLGNNQFVHATTSEGVAIDSFDDSEYWDSKYTGAKRYDALALGSIESPIAKEAISLLGAPYKSEGDSPEGFNISGFVEYVFQAVANTTIPGLTEQQWEIGQEVADGDLQPGDVVFFSNTYKEGISHNGIYLGNDQFAHVTTSSGVVIDFLQQDSYYRSKYTGARRYSNVKPEPTSAVAKKAIELIGTPYKNGGDTSSGLSSYGFIEYVFNNAADIYIPSTRDNQWKVGEKVLRENLQPGDIVFFSNTYKSGLSHNGVYLGNDQFAHVTTSEGVIIDYLDKNSYYNERYTGARRYGSLKPVPDDADATEAINLIGSPYKSGGEEPSGFDSSGFIQYVFQNGNDTLIPRKREDQWLIGEKVEKENLQPGDVVFFSDTYKPGLSHNGIYIGQDQFVHVTTSSGVTIDYIDKNNYYRSKYTGAKRYDNLQLDVSDPVGRLAISLVGTPYLSGGDSPKGFSSYGLIKYIFNEGKGIVLPTSRDDQWKLGEEIPKEDLKPGDVVFFSNTYKKGLSHNGVYLGEDQFAHVTTSSGVKIDYLDKNSYYSSRYTGARRYNDMKVEAVNDVTTEALSHLNAPHKSGGESPSGFDSSGFIQYVFQTVLETALPRTTDDQWKTGEEVSEELQPGDVVFFSNTYKEGISHNGIYLGNDQFIHVTTSDGVVIDYLNKSDYYSSKYSGARRYSDLKVVAENAITKEAMNLVGSPYESGGEVPEGFNSSGYIQYVFEKAADIYIPRYTEEQSAVGETISLENLKPGDVVFFENTYKEGISHNGIYLGKDQFAHVTSSDGVTIDYLNKSNYYSSKFAFAKRYDGLKLQLDIPVVSVAASYLGVPYELGTERMPDFFDCSSFVQQVYNEVFDIYLPRTSTDQWEFGNPVAKADLQPGDVVFFSDTYQPGISHEGIYVGNGQIIHSNGQAGKVSVGYLNHNSYYSPKYTGARRYNVENDTTTNNIMNEAKIYLGVPYLTGGRTPEGFNASGFVQYVYAQNDIVLPNYGSQQIEIGSHVDKQDLQPGDLVFFEGNYIHPGIYVGNNEFIHVTETYGVYISNLEESSYWAPKYKEGRRIIE